MQYASLSAMVRPLIRIALPMSTRPGSPAAWTSTAWMICLLTGSHLLVDVS